VNSFSTINNAGAPSAGTSSTTDPKPANHAGHITTKRAAEDRNDDWRELLMQQRQRRLLKGAANPRNLAGYVTHTAPVVRASQTFPAAGSRERGRIVSSHFRTAASARAVLVLSTPGQFAW
jgi:hypothetical protein